jgi:hypothetical protein
LGSFCKNSFPSLFAEVARTCSPEGCPEKHLEREGEMSRTKNQHYLPQCLLERFTAEGRLYVFDKTMGRRFCTSPRNVASEMYFYDLPAGIKGVSVQAVEQHFSKLEGQLAEMLRLLTSDLDANRRIPEEARDALAPHLVMLLLRTKEYRTQMTQRADFASLMMRRIGKVPPRIKSQALEHAKFMFNLRVSESFAAALRRHLWVVGRNDTAHPLYLSDAPIVRIPHRENEGCPQTGLTSPGIEIAFPISPRYILLLWERTHFAEVAARDRGIMVLPAEAVRCYNAMQVLSAYQRIFCSADDFDLAREMVRAHPEHCQPDRDRFEYYDPGHHIEAAKAIAAAADSENPNAGPSVDLR